MALSRRWLLAHGGAAIALVASGCSSGDGRAEADRTASDDDTAPSDDTTSSDPDTETSGSFGEVITLGSLPAVRDEIAASSGVLYVPDGRFWLVEADDGGLVALYQKCTHLGCRVPYCSTSGWFECPCHGSVYDDVGEYVSGPAPRSLDRFAVDTDGARVQVDTSVVVKGKDASLGPSTAQPAGPHCIRTG